MDLTAANATERTGPQAFAGGLGGAGVLPGVYPTDLVWSNPYLSGQDAAVTGHRTLLRTLGSAGATWSGGLPGYGPAELPSYALYRRMSAHPTLALAKAVVCAPILASEWSYEADEGVPDERVEFIRTMFDPMRAHLLNQLLRSLEFGWRGFEKVFVIDGGRYAFSKFKPLRPERTEILTDRATGAFAGFRQKDVTLPLDKCFLYSNDLEDDDFRGRSRHENIRETAWWNWVNAAGEKGRLNQKISGIIPLVKYPDGEGLDANGASVQNYTNALTIIGGLAAGRGVIMPNLVGSLDDPRLAAELSKASAWDVDFYDAGSTATASGGFIDELRYWDSLMLRGWLLPERMAIEGQFGTKAEAATHADIGLTNSELLHQDMVRCINWHAVDQVLALNFGEEARGSVYITPGPLLDSEKLFFRDLWTQMLGNPGAAYMLMNAMDIDAMADRIGIPKKTGVIDITLPDQQQTQEPGMNGDGEAGGRLAGVEGASNGDGN